MEKALRQLLSPVQLFVTPWTGARQALLSMEFFKQEYWRGWPFPSPEDLPDPGLNPAFPHSRQILYGLSHQGSPIEKMWKQSKETIGWLQLKATSAVCDWLALCSNFIILQH